MITNALLGDGGDMELTVYHEREQRTTTISFTGTTVQELLTHLAINPETVLIVRKGEVITEQAVLQNKDTIEILSVISGG